MLVAIHSMYDMIRHGRVDPGLFQYRAGKKKLVLNWIVSIAIKIGLELNTIYFYKGDSDTAFGMTNDNRIFCCFVKIR